MITVTDQGIEELKNILEQMKCSGCGEEHEHGGSCCDEEHEHGGSCCDEEPAHAESGCGSHCGCGCEGHDAVECSIDELVLRMVIVENESIGLVLDMPRDGDNIIEQDGVNLLLVDQNVAEMVKDLVLDCADTVDGRRLTITSSRQ